jgi:hypothetical protein
MKLFDLVQKCHDIGLDCSVHPYTFNRLMFIGRTNHIYAENGVGTNLVSAPIDGGKTDTTCWSTQVMLARIAEAAKHPEAIAECKRRKEFDARIAQMYSDKQATNAAA